MKPNVFFYHFYHPALSFYFIFIIRIYLLFLEKNTIKTRFIFEIISNLDRVEWNENLSSIYPLAALLAPLPLIPFSADEITGCTNELAKGANKSPRYLLYCFFI